ncbi:hypothetical protein N7474_002252 [Penicillium riverlandense]|uniref:uncharacterized protein n=1 Tax=Penicillium riverlandense TaxID=1903569 RepID=UPI00254879E2|nr:uncharacterized protein N7474_002252 [Penicillium riverlandense]KAJ5833941.1 hypothetical protein N7474_002252 [Penicillium riverlandense]
MEQQHESNMPYEKVLNNTVEAPGVDLGQILAATSMPEEEQRVLRKLDFILVPLMGCAYFLQFLYKLALSQTTLFNLRQDLVWALPVIDLKMGIEAAMSGENRPRDRLYGHPEENIVGQELPDELSNKTDRQLDSFRYIL